MAAAALVLPATPVAPSTYHRIVSPTLHIPTDSTLPIPVGLLACQRDPLLREIRTTVVSCNVHQPQEAPANNRKKKSASNAVQALLEVILHDTVLFPEGGGQPSDIGLLQIEDGEVLEVVEVKRKGGHAVHFVKNEGKTQSLVVGQRVIASLGEAGFNRRLDHMSMHTSQHMLSALLETRLNLPTLSWALTTYPTPSYVELPRALTVEEVASIQAEANKLAFEGRAVHVEVEELDRDRVEKAAVHESGRAIGKALPEDYTGGVKRTVIIDGVDRNPCCGTHLPSLNNLQIFILPQTESVARSAMSTSRLFWLCGPRLIMHMTSTHNLLTTTSSIMSCGFPLVPERVQQAVDQRKIADKRVEDLERELAGSIAQELAQEMIKDDTTSKFYRHYHRIDDSPTALPFLQSISSTFAARTETITPLREHLLVLTSSPSSQSNSSTSLVLLSGSDEKQVKAVGEALKSKLAVKGGGKGQKWSGKRVGVWKEAREGEIVASTLSEVQSS